MINTYNHNYTTTIVQIIKQKEKLQNENWHKAHGFSLIWSLCLGAWSAASGLVSFSLSLRDSCAGKVTKANCFSKS